MARILIVDDYLCLRSLVAATFEDEGHCVDCTGDPDAAWESIDRLKPDLVLFELYSNGKHRWDALHEIKKQNPRLPVVILTAYDSYGRDPRVAHVDGFVIKSSDFGELKRTVAQVLETKRVRVRRANMQFQEIRKLAKGLGINTFRMKKTDLIHSIQRAEGNIDCYATPRVQHCGELECLWRSDCLRANGGAGQKG
jgi:DNA-binding NarL/FixJ family response regulator